jgi:meckelin
LINDLKKEENNLCAHRGLIPGTTNQTFIASFSSSFREIYYKLLNLQNPVNKLLYKNCIIFYLYFLLINNFYLKSEGRFLRREILGSLTWEKNLQSHLKIKKFLTAFIDHCFKDLDYVIKDRLLIEKLCDLEIGKNNDQSTFYIGTIKY